jgi:alkanesulfonate monooxygenase SsuD/methylene tetrahydromethanopterin reductase-like flavin-dependent oxidoreductase (luciferase family)
LFINTRFSEGFNLAERIPEMIAQVRAARDAGFASLWFLHHWLTHPMQMLQITPVMGYIAAHAQGMTIGPNILILPPLNPVHVAEEAATLDVLTGGNFILGVGLGDRQPEFDAFDISISERAPRFNESVALMRRLWTEERMSHKGRFYMVNEAGIGVKPVRPGGPPLYVAGQADVSVRRAARIGDAWLIVNTGGRGKVNSLMQTYRAALKEYGRTPMEFRSPSNATLAHAMPQRTRNVGGRWNTSTTLCVVGVGEPHHTGLVRGFRARQVHHRRQGVGKGRDRAVPRAFGCRSLHHALSVGLPQKQVLSSIQRLGEIFAS